MIDLIETEKDASKRAKPIEELLECDPDDSLWERLYWQFKETPFAALTIFGYSDFSVETHFRETRLR